jgi:fatty acid amide hydrolase
VGYYANDGVVPVSTAVARAVEVARAALSAAGCETVPFTPPDVASLFDEYLAAMSADGGEGLMDALRDDPVDPTLAPLLQLAKVPDSVRRAMARGARIAGQAGLARMLDAMGKKSVAAFWGHTYALRRYRAELLDMMDAVGVDVILCPAYATPALPHGMSKNFTAASTPALLYNAVQFPGGVVPVTRVRPDETRRPSPQGMVEKHAAKVDAKSAGLPVGVQLVARPWQDEVAMAVMATLEAALRDRGDVPRTPVTP